MAIYRGPGGAGDATNDATSQAILANESALAAAASQAAAAGSASSAATSATNAASSATSVANSATTATTEASNAATSATNAANSAATATTKASEASTSATNAAASESAAASSATAAASSATSASNSATLATTKASEASTSATSAASSANAAAASATTASTQATNAGNSATAAATSATNAANSATAAAGSATSAASSASTATTQATNAASSATAAATSATNAATSETNAAASATSAASSATTATTQATNSANSATASASSASSAAASAAAAAASYDSFDDRYLGSKTSDPALDNDGNALVTGALYYNSVAGEMRVYDGAIWLPASAASQAILTVYRYTATAGQTTFSGSDDSALTLAYTVGSVLVTLNGVTLEVGTDVTATTGTSVVLAVGAAAGDEVNIYAFSTFDIANTYTQAQADAKYLTITNPSYTGTFTGGTGVMNIGSGQLYKAASGNVGIGTSSPTEALEISRDTNPKIRFVDVGNIDAKVGIVGSTALGFEVNGTERMRIDSSGNLLVGTTSSTNPHALTSGSGAMLNNICFASFARESDTLYLNRTGATNGGVARFYRNGTNVGSIDVTTTATSYVTSSDYRLKENIQPMQNALSVVAQLNPVTYTWKADGSDGQGFIAHELQAVVPDCVTGEKDAVREVDVLDEDGKKIGVKEEPVYQGIDTSFLVATLCKAIQEQQEQINILTTKVAALEAK